ncbi:MCE family protein, partial [bacterium]|nr:MCE family protein [bacterium]
MSKEAKLGLFVVIVVAVFMFFTINMGALFFKQGEKTFQIYFDSVGTLEEGAPVKQAGLDVGFVEEKAKEIVYNPTKSVDIVVTIRTNEKADIAIDSKASIQTMGMMGEKYIELTFGTSPVSATEATRIEGQGPVALDNVMENAVALTNEVQTTVESLNEIFGDEKFKNNLLLFVGNMESFSEKLNNMMGGERQRLQTILTNIKTASADLSRLIATAELFITDSREMVNENRPAIHKTLANTADISETLKNDVMDEVKFTVSNMNNTMIDVKEFVADLRSFSTRLNTSVDKVDGIIAKVDGVVEENKPDIKDSFSNLKKFSENASQASDRIDNLLKQIQDRDGLIHKVIYDEEMAESTKKTIAQTEGVMNTFSTFP